MSGKRLSMRQGDGELRSVESQTDPPNHSYGEYQDAYERIGGGNPVYPEEPVLAGEAGGASSDWQYYQLPGYHGLPVMQPLKVMNPYGGTVTSGSVPLRRAAATAHPVPFNRAGRMGSNWRHMTQCTGNLGNHIVFINGRVKSDDCQLFPPNGFPAGAAPGAQAVAAPARRQPSLCNSSYQQPAGLGANGGKGGQYNTRALGRARAGTKYWYEDKRPATLTPNTIQGRIMKSGTAY